MLVDLISFLLDNGASVSDSFDGQEGLCALHLVSGNVLFTDLIELMVVTYEADVDIQDRNGTCYYVTIGNGMKAKTKDISQ